MRNTLLRALAIAAMAAPLAAGQVHAQAGLLTGGAEKLEPIKLSSGQPLTSAPTSWSPANITRSRSRRTDLRKSRWSDPTSSAMSGSTRS